MKEIVLKLMMGLTEEFTGAIRESLKTKIAIEQEIIRADILQSLLEKTPGHHAMVDYHMANTDDVEGEYDIVDITVDDIDAIDIDSLNLDDLDYVDPGDDDFEDDEPFDDEDEE